MINTLLPNAQPANAGGAGLTDEQIAQLRQYSQALQGNQQPVHAWTQGLSNLTGDIVGALQKRKADQAVAAKNNTNDAVTGILSQGKMPYFPNGSSMPSAGGGISPAPPSSPITAAPPPAPAASASPPVQAPPYAQPNQNWQGATPAPYMADLQTETDPSNMSTG